MGADGLLVIGYGNPLRGDDAAGPLAARQLARRGFHALDVHQLTPELAEEVARADTVIFLDAHAGVSAGEVRVVTLRADAAARTPLEHCASPGGLLRLARTAYGSQPEAWMIGIGGSNFEFGERLSGPARKALAHTVREVIRLAAGEG